MLAYYFGSAPKYWDTQSRDSWLYWFTINRLASLWLCVLWSVKRQNTHIHRHWRWKQFPSCILWSTWPFCWTGFTSPHVEGALEERLLLPGSTECPQYLHGLSFHQHSSACSYKVIWQCSDSRLVKILFSSENSHLCKNHAAKNSCVLFLLKNCNSASYSMITRYRNYTLDSFIKLTSDIFTTLPDVIASKNPKKPLRLWQEKSSSFKRLCFCEQILER